jgi:hypothetical protein
MVLLIAPMGMHRSLFRRRWLEVLVSAAHRCAQAGLLLLGGTVAQAAMFGRGGESGTT